MNTTHKICIWIFFFLTTTTIFAQPVSDQFEKVNLLWEQGRFKTALEAAQAVNSAVVNGSDTQRAQAYLLLSKCFNSLGQRDSAIAYSKLIIISLEKNKNSSYYEALLQLGLGLTGKGKVAEAKDTLQAVFENFERTRKNQMLLAEARLVLGIGYLLKNDFENAKNELNQALQLAENDNKNITGLINNYAGIALWKLGQYEAAIVCFKKGEDIFFKSGGSDHNSLGALYINMGGCYDDMGFYRKAIACYEKALSNLILQNPNHPNLVNAYHNLGRSYSHLGEHSLAARYLEKAVGIQPRNGRYWNNLGDVYLGMEAFEKADTCFNKALQILLAASKLDSLEIARPYHNLAIIYRHQGLIDKALEFEFRSLPFRKSGGELRELDIAHTYSGIGDCYFKLEAYQKAIVYQDSALFVLQLLIPSGLHEDIANTYVDKAECLIALQDYTAAAQMLDNALTATGFQQQFQEVHAPLALLTALQMKGTLSRILFEREKNIPHLQAANETYQLAAQAIQYFRTQLLENQSKAAVAGQYRDILAEGVEVARLLYENNPTNAGLFQQAFALAEQSKSLLLLEGLRESGAVQFADIPAIMLNQEKEWQQTIADTEIRLHNLDPSEEGYNTLKDSLFLYQRDYETFKKQLAREYPSYYNFKHDLSFATVDQLQQNLLQPNQTLLEYFITDSSIITFIIQRDKKEIVEWKKDFPLEDWVKQLQEGLYGYYSATKKTDALYEKTVRQYAQVAQQLYQKLILPIQNKLTNQLLIMPDGALGYVPFEALLSAAPKDLVNFNTYPFLVQQYQIGYCYSATLLREMMQKQHRSKPAKSILAIAPFYKGTKKDLETQSALALEKLLLEINADALADRKSFKPLPNSGEEVYVASELWKGDYYIHTAGTKQTFLQSAADYRILHLSTHGVADNRVGDYSYLAFVDQRDSTELLYVRDLYNVSLNADLVVLSACETATGELQSGEGIISLARAFAYAGAKSLVTTLWIANDASTKDLMKTFHTQLRKGDSKDKALQTAKTRYLAANKGERAHPFFWAGFVGVGDVRVLK